MKITLTPTVPNDVNRAPVGAFAAHKDNPCTIWRRINSGWTDIFHDSVQTALSSEYVVVQIKSIDLEQLK